MKFSRRNVRMVAAILWVTLVVLIGSSAIYPLWKMEREIQGEISELQEKIQRGNEVAASVEAMRITAAQTRDALARMTQPRPMGPPAVWFPEKLKEHLRRFGITQSEVRLNSAIPDPEMPEFQQTFWNVRIPAQTAVKNIQAVLQALSTLEETEPYLRVLDCAFAMDETAPFGPAGSFNVSAVVRE